MSWPLLLALAAGSYGLRALGVTVFGRIVETRLQSVASLMPAVLFPALIAVMTFEDEGRLVLDARAAGVAAGAVAAWRDASMLGVVTTAMAVTAGLRVIA